MFIAIIMALAAEKMGAIELKWHPINAMVGTIVIATNINRHVKGKNK